MLGHPDRPLDLERFPEDAQVFNCHNFCRLLDTAGMPFVYYGLAGSRVPGHGVFADLGEPSPPWEYGNAWHRAYTRRLDRALQHHLTDADTVPQVLASLYGCAHADLRSPERFDLPVVEAMVGYDHCWAPFRVFPSYAQQSVIYAQATEQVRQHVWFDTVIPHFLDPDAYEVADRRGDYALFLGRDVPGKGRHIAEYTCERAGVPFRVYHSGLKGREKTELLSRAVAVFMPTVYVEPFGYVAVEAQMSGVPAITTDWGAFAETVEQGRTGFRCRTAAEFGLALTLAPALDPAYIRARAVRLYSIAAAVPAYMAYLDLVWRACRHGGFFAEQALSVAFRDWRPAQRGRL